jgi:hypothetical protein
LALQTRATFANGTADESFSWLIRDGKAWLMGWNINSPLLIIN